jgi:hypothetical protein
VENSTPSGGSTPLSAEATTDSRFGDNLLLTVVLAIAPDVTQCLPETFIID